jgi:hypothetical protein
LKRRDIVLWRCILVHGNFVQHWTSHPIILVWQPNMGSSTLAIAAGKVDDADAGPPDLSRGGLQDGWPPADGARWVVAKASATATLSRRVRGRTPLDVKGHIGGEAGDISLVDGISIIVGCVIVEG